MIIRLCLKSLPTIGYRRLICDHFEPRNVFWYENTFACCFRGFFCRFKSTRSGLFKSLTDTVSGKGRKPEEDIKITDSKSSKLEEDMAAKIVKSNPAKIQAERLNLSKIKPVTIDPGIAAPKIKINEKICVKNNVQPEPEVLRELSDKVQKIKINPIKKSDDPFSQFQQLLTIPQLHLDQKLNMKRRESTTKKKSSPKSLSKGKFIPQQLAKNKTDPKLYENLTLLKDPEPQCEFLELQSGRKRISMGGLSDVNQTNSKSNLTNSRTMASQAENRPPSKPIVKKKSILPSDRLEKRLLLETPKIKAIKNRLSKMDRYWIIAAKKKTSEAKISDSLLRLRDRICQQIEASKNFKYGMEPMRLAVVGNEEDTGDRSIDKFSKSRTDEVASSRNVLERVKIMNRKLKTEPYIPPIVTKKPLVKKNSGGKLILKKMTKKERKKAKALDQSKTDSGPLEVREKLYSHKIRAKIMKFSEKRKNDIAKEEALVRQTQEEEGPDARYTPLENKTDANPPEIVTATPIEIPAPAPENKPEEPSKPAEEPKKPEYLEVKTDNPQPPRPRLNFSTVNFPKHNSWNIKPRPESSEEHPRIRKPEPRPSMTLKSAMEGFKMDSAVNRIILQAKARSMGVKTEEMLTAPKESKETPKKKKTETIRRSSFFKKKKKSNKTKENILSVDKTDGAEVEEVTKRSRVPIRIPENVPENKADPKNPPPTQEEVAKKIRQWYLPDRLGEDPKPSQEKTQVPTLEKVHPEVSLWPIEHKNKKEETKAEENKGETPPPVPKTEEIKKIDGNAQTVSVTPDPVSNIPSVAEPRVEETKKADSNDNRVQIISETVPDPVQSVSQSSEAAPSAVSKPQIEETKKEAKKNYNVWVPSDPVFQKKVQEEFLLKRPKSKARRQDVKKIEPVFKKAPNKVAAAQKPQNFEVRKSESNTKKGKKEGGKYDTRVGSTIKKESMWLYEKPIMSVKKTEKTKKVTEAPKEEVKFDPVVAQKIEEPPKLEPPKLEEAPKLQGTPKIEEPTKLEEPLILAAPLKAEEPLKLEKPRQLEEPMKSEEARKWKEPLKLEDPSKWEQPLKSEEPPKWEQPLKFEELPKWEDPSKWEQPLKSEEPPKWEEPLKLEEPPKWEEPLKFEETPQRPSIDPPPVSEAELDEIGRPIRTIEIRKIASMASKEEDNPVKGAINIKLKPLSEIENLTKAVKEYEKRLEDHSGIDVFEEIISKKIETIPCAKPKLPPYYYTPYSSSTVETEELPNKKEDKADEK